MASQKLGHPVPLSYFAVLENSGIRQAEHRNVPSRCSPFPEVPAWAAGPG